MDLSKLSTEDLLALKAGDLSKVSTPGLQALRHSQAADAVNNDAISQGARNFNSGAGFLDNFNAGAGKAFSDVGMGLKQKVGLANGADVEEMRKLDAPLMKTGGGILGNIGGNVTMVAPASLVPGAQTVPGAGIIGAVAGSVQPAKNFLEGAFNTGVGALSGMGGQWLSNKMAGTAAFQESENAAKTAAGAQKTAAARAASDAGYVIPPEDVGQGGGIVTKILSGTGGKIKTAQVASERNQSVTNNLAKQALGMAETDPLTPQTLAALRSQAGQAYNAVKGSGTVAADATYAKALDDIAAKYTTTAQAFPGAVKSEIPDLVAALKQPTFSADAAVEMTKILRGKADMAFIKGDKGEGKAMKEAADVMEGMLERHLQAAGSPDALKAFQDARQLIAKTYTVEKGLNGTTGDVSAKALATALARGKPLTDELLTVAKANQGFPMATQTLKEAPKTLSPLDMAVAYFKSDPKALLTLGARPAARSALLSGPMQQSALNAAETPAPANALARLLSNQDVVLPLSVGGGNAVAAQFTR